MPTMTAHLESLPPDLTDLVLRGLRDWDEVGPARATDPIARLFGLRDAAEMVADFARLAGLVQAGQALTNDEWKRVLGATELALASDCFGTGSEWTVINGGSETEWFIRLRRLQSIIQELP